MALAAHLAALFAIGSSGQPARGPLPHPVATTSAAQRAVRATQRLLASGRVALLQGIFETLERVFGVVVEPYLVQQLHFGRQLHRQGGTLGAGRVHSHGDHRVAMSCAIAALRASGPVIVEDCSNVATSFPGFVTTAQAVGLTVSAEPGGADD